MLKQIILGWGKLRRMLLVYLRPKKVSRHLKNRSGECQRCGACCALMFRCPWLDKTDGLVKCKFYDWRSHVCRTFPLDERDISDRDLVNQTRKCGFSFKPE